MVQRIKDFSEGCRKGLGIVVECSECKKLATFRAADFRGYIPPGADIEDMTWRCTWCRAVATYIRYVPITPINRESLSQWTPPPGRRPKF